MKNNIEKELDAIRIKLYNETKNLNFTQKKEREQKMMDELKKEGFNFNFFTEYSLSENDSSNFMIAEETTEYNEKGEID